MEISLHEQWTLTDGEKNYPCQVPCSVYDTLVTSGALPGFSCALTALTRWGQCT